MTFAGIACPTVIITGYEALPREDGKVPIGQLQTELAEEFPDLFKGILHYNSTFDEWKVELTRLLANLAPDEASR